MTAGGAAVVSPRVEGGLRASKALRLGVIARYAYASAEDPLGRVTVHGVTGGVAATFTVLARRSFAVASGPRVELGWLGGSGEGQNGRSTSTFAASGAWEIELSVPLGPVTLFGAVEGGALVRGLQLRADERTVLDMSGALLGASAGVAL